MTAPDLRDLVDEGEPRRQRRARLAATDHRYGLDFVDVVSAEPASRWTLRLGFVPDLSGSSSGHGYPPTLRPEQVAIDRAGQPPGGRLPEIGALRFTRLEGDTITLEVELRRAPPAEVLRGPLTLSLAHVPGLDPLFVSADFALSAERRPLPDAAAEPAVIATPGATYAVKDYAGFAGVMMDRLRLTLPGWEERSPADLAVMLVELMAYAADYLSYQQDAAATEAYLGTARKRRSLRRHARLLDYLIDEGRSARAWLQIDVTDQPRRRLPAGWTFRTGSIAPPVVFESLHEAVLYRAHNAPPLYAWGIEPYVIAAGATSLVLDGDRSTLRAGDVLVLVSHGDPRAAAAEPYQAHPVRLAEAPVVDRDPVLDRVITRVSWFTDDALPFPLYAGETEGLRWSEVHGNVVLVEQHTTFQAKQVTPAGPGTFVVPLQGAIPEGPIPEGWEKETLAVASAQPYDDDAARAAPAAAALVQDPAFIRPCVSVTETRAGDPAAWTGRRTFLTSARFARDVVVDIDEPGSIQLTFGDGTLTRALSPEAELEVRFGVGGGPAGNVGRDTIGVIDNPGAFPEGALRVSQWLPASGGGEAESAAQVKVRAPIAFLEQQRCVAPSDYADAAERIPGVRAAVATLAWTGSYTSAVVHVLPEASDALDEGLWQRVADDLFRRRLAGMDLEVRPPVYVPIAVSLRVGLAPGYEAGAVREALETELGAGDFEDGRQGLFHRDGYGFGEPLHLAPIVARAAAVPGVAYVRPLRFARWEDAAALAREPATTGETARLPAEPDTVIALGETEIARVRGDVESPEAGLVGLEIEEAS